MPWNFLNFNQMTMSNETNPRQYLPDFDPSITGADAPSDPGGGAPPGEVDALQVQIDEAREQAQSLAWARKKVQALTYDLTIQQIRCSELEEELWQAQVKLEERDKADIQADIDPKSAASTGKVPLHLVPPVLEEHVAGALAVGAGKYGAWNWRTGTRVEVMEYVRAVRSHLNKYIEGQDTDEEGQSHLGAIAASCAILLDTGTHGNLIDNRPVGHRP